MENDDKNRDVIEKVAIVSAGALGLQRMGIGGRPYDRLLAIADRMGNEKSRKLLGVSVGIKPAGPAKRKFKNVGRNVPCPCGSGKKFKKCCIDVMVS